MYYFDKRPIDAEDLTATDLRELAGDAIACYRVVVFDAPESADAIVIDGVAGCRIGIAWGGNATWGDVYGTDTDLGAAVDDALADFFGDDADAWTARS